MTADVVKARHPDPGSGPIAHPAEWPVYTEEARRQVAGLVGLARTFDYGYGPELAAFESEFAARHGRRHALAMCSGTAALLAAFAALGFGPGDEVIVPDYTFFSTATPLFLLGAVPVLADAAAPQGAIDPGEVEALVGPRTAGLVVTHLWGHPAELGPLLSIAAKHGLATVEDCSHAHGATLDGEPVGSRSDIAIFSVGGHKAVSGGMGGILLTNSADLYARACLVTNFRHRTDLTIQSPAYQPFLTTGLGGNFRMSPLAAVLAHSHLAQLDRLVAARAANMTSLLRRIGRLPGVRPVPIRAGCTMGAWYDGVVEITDQGPYPRDELVTLLKREGLRVREPAARPLHTYPLFQGSGPDWNRLLSGSVRRCGELNDREFPGAAGLYRRWVRMPVNFLWDDEGVIVEPYAAAFERVLAPR